VKVVIVDDEPLARARLRRLLAAHADIAIVAECADGATAIAAVRAHRPDLLFLDVQMPELDGFAVLAALGDPGEAAVVFVTAYERHAARAFDAEAVDYLVKPYDAPRLARAVTRARARGEARRSGRSADRTRELAPRLDALLAALPAPATRLPVRVGEHIEMLDLADVDYFEAEGNYVAVHTAGKVHLIRDTLTAMASRLDPRRFVRIHRSRIVRIDQVRTIAPLFHGEYRLTLRDGTQLTSGRSYRDALRAALGIRFA
jgi:two-component system LytT family response regulator